MRRIIKTFHLATRLQLGERMRERRAVRRIRKSNLFDSKFYLQQNSDVLEEDFDPIVHYVRHGAAEGRDPNPLFDSALYWDRYPDVRERGSTPLDHFITHGWAEGRSPHRLFDVPFYLDENPDVVEAGMNPLQHYLEFGKAEGRAPHAQPSVRPLDDSPRESSTQIALHSIPGRSRISSLDGLQPRSACHDDPIVVFVSHVLPYPPRAGNEYRIHRLVRWLESRGYQVIMVCCPLPGEEATESEILCAAEEFTNLVYCDRRGDLTVSLASHFDAIVSELDGQQVSIDLPNMNRLSREAEENLIPETILHERTFCPDILVHLLVHMLDRLPPKIGLVASYVFNTRYLPSVGPEVLKILDTIDVFSTKKEKVCAFGVDDPLSLSREEERTLLRRADVVLAIQPEERGELVEIVPDRPVITVGLDFDCASEKDVETIPPSGTPRILLVGSSNQLNVKGLDDFLRFAWPYLRRDHPKAELVVVGSIGAGMTESLPGVRCMGSADSLDPLYRDCHLVINPAVAGTGVKIKTLEALAHHRPVVTWQAGVDGLSPELRTLCVVVQNWYEFYLEVSKLLERHPEETFSRKMRDRTRIALSGSTAYAPLVEILDHHLREATPMMNAEQAWTAPPVEAPGFAP